MADSEIESLPRIAACFVFQISDLEALTPKAVDRQSLAKQGSIPEGLPLSVRVGESLPVDVLFARRSPK